MKVVTSSVVLVGAAVGACIASVVAFALVVFADTAQRMIERLEIEVEP